MNYERKKELIEQYKQTKQDMGVYALECTANNNIYIGYAKDIRGKMNRDRFSLLHGSHFNRRLQEDWNLHGEEGFSIRVLEVLEYDKEGVKTDYTEDLKILLQLWFEKLPQARKLRP